MSTDWIDRDARVVWHGFTQMATYADNSPRMIDRAKGHYLIDVEGRRYLDAISSLWVNTMGHNVKELNDALRAQLDKVAHSTLLGHGNTTVVELAEALATSVPVDKPHFLFASDGAAAVEQALKIAFQYWVNEGDTSRTTYLALGDAYHGDTIGGLSLGGGGFGTDIFDALRFPVVRSPGYDDPDALRKAAHTVKERGAELAAVVIEPLVQGAAGMHLASPGAFAELQSACDDSGVLLVCDEVATGFGRTGTLFASEQCGLSPDIMSMGKGITGGYLPLAATAVSERVYQAFLGEDLGPRTLYHGHSYSGNALAAAVALRHLQLLEQNDVLSNVQERSSQLLKQLSERIEPLAEVAEVRLRGLMVGVELRPSRPGGRRGRLVSAGCVERGVLVRPLGDVIVLMPPLTITAPEVEQIVETLRAAIEAEIQ
jgi:adenosylmethionine---8-amino-7-oxononanoate aminotransferase